jgi:hypothetical protein
VLLPALAWLGDAGDVAACAGAETALLLGAADGLAETGELGANCAHAAMTTRSPAGSALPPTPLWSTK